MTLEQFILDYIGQHRSARFDELQEAGQQAGYPMTGDIEFGPGRAFFWCGMSQEFAEAVCNLLDSGQARIVRTTKLDCFLSDRTIIMSKKRWIPSRLEAARPQTSSPA